MMNIPYINLLKDIKLLKARVLALEEKSGVKQDEQPKTPKKKVIGK